MGSCAAPSAKGDDKFITTDYLQQCPFHCFAPELHRIYTSSFELPLCWLRSKIPVTSLSMLPGISSLTAAMHPE
ncbi:hypothetical protein EEQ48_16690 [Salmonella enterica subsp. enterica serovar Typhimurium]|nr:hypothetical protein [Salmonella enterica subsp. enterica serovar Typhimurium]